MVRFVIGAALALFAVGVFGPQKIAAQNSGAIVGRVVDWANDPAPGTEVRVASLGRVARVGEDGRFRFDDVPAGRYVVLAYNDALGSTNGEVVVSGGEDTELVLRLDPLFHLEGVFVSVAGEPVRADDLYQAANALSGRELRAALDASLGETLAGQPGVSSTYFGPAASRPVIRGLTGDRVRVLEAGIGTGDASTTSPDHAVSVESQLARRIEIIRGPATLLYGGSAIGGVVNVLDNRVPEELPAESVTGQLISAGGTVANERNVSGEVNGRAGRFAWHASGLFRETDDYGIPGFAEADHDEEEHEAGEHEEEEEEEGVLPNSALETARAAFGVSYVSDNGFFGVSVSGYDSEYGVPGGHGHGEEHEEGEHAEEEEEEESVAIDLRQRRFDMRGEWRFGGAYLRGLRVRFGQTDYEHTELEGEEVGTVFDNKEWEARVEGQTSFGELVHGAIGLQLGNRDFAAIGEEAFTPPTDTDQLAAFLFQEVDLGRIRLQGGARYESREATNTDEALTRSFDDMSFSLGANWSATEAVGFALSFAHSKKQPSVEELFSNGPHVATRSFELGDPFLGTETANSVDLTARVSSHRLNGEVTGYVNDFSDFVYQEFAGTEEDGFPVLRYTQADSRFAGIEGRADLELAEFQSLTLGVEAWGDYVWAELTDSGEPLPRITPARVGLGVRLGGAPWDAGLRLRHVTQQDRVAANEEVTEGYTMLDAQVGYRLSAGGFVHELVLQGRNLTDTEARSHVSLLKEFAPMPGRELRLMYRLAF